MAEEIAEENRFVYLEDLGNFDLSKMWTVFEIAPFERQSYESHVKGIKNAIANRRLIDFVITVYRINENSKWRVIDGQHRLLALFDMYDDGKLKSYPITLRVINAKSEKEARDIYLSMNSGKQLINNDILKAYDSGHVYFFNELRSICTHHNGTVDKLSYVNCLASLHYVKEGEASLRKNFLASFLTTVENWEVLRIKELLQTMFIISNGNARNIIFFANVFRPLTRLYFEDFRNATGKKWENYIRSLENDQTIKANKGKWTTESCNMIYEYLKTKWERVK